MEALGGEAPRSVRNQRATLCCFWRWTAGDPCRLKTTFPSSPRRFLPPSARSVAWIKRFHYGGGSGGLQIRPRERSLVVFHLVHRVCTPALFSEWKLQESKMEMWWLHAAEAFAAPRLKWFILAAGVIEWMLTSFSRVWTPLSASSRIRIGVSADKEKLFWEMKKSFSWFYNRTRNWAVFSELCTNSELVRTQLNCFSLFVSWDIHYLLCVVVCFRRW